MRVRAFAKRNMKELFRDPLTLFFGLGFPLALLLMMTLIQRNIPVHVFELDTLAPGMALFGLTFMALFSGLLLAKDRSSAFLARLTASPMTASDFLLGYLLPLLPMAVGQSVICLGAAVALGLPLSWNLPAAVAALIPSALLFIALGLLCGTLFNDKQVGGLFNTFPLSKISLKDPFGNIITRSNVIPLHSPKLYDKYSPVSAFYHFSTPVYNFGTFLKPDKIYLSIILIR